MEKIINLNVNSDMTRKKIKIYSITQPITCQECCIGVSEGNGVIYPGDPKHEGHEWSVIKNQCKECIFYFKVNSNSPKPHDQQA